MKKLINLLCCLLLVGCSTNNVSKEEYEIILNENLTIIAENNYLKTQNTQLKLENEALKSNVKEVDDTTDVKISGGFVATVRAIMPDYELDDKTNRVLVLQFFQGDLFLMNVGEMIASQVKVGKTYYFNIKESVFLKEDYGLTVEKAKKYSWDIIRNQLVEIESFRNLKDDEGGMHVLYLEFEDINAPKEDQYTALIKELNKMKNEYSDNDYKDKELCEHPRGEYKTYMLEAYVWSEPHIYNTYYIEIKNNETNEQIKIYFDEENLINIESVLVENYGFTKVD